MDLLRQMRLLGCSLGMHSMPRAIAAKHSYVSRTALFGGPMAKAVETGTKACRHCGAAQELFKQRTIWNSDPKWKPVTPEVRQEITEGYTLLR